MKCEMCFDDCLDLPSLTQIQGNHNCIQKYIGHVILESMIWFDLIWLDIPNLTENNIHYGHDSFGYTADLQSTSTFPFHFHFHILDAPGLEKVIRKMPKEWRKSCCSIFWEKPHFSHSLKEEEDRVLSLSKSSFVLLNFRCLFDCNQFQPFSQSNREGVSSSLTNDKITFSFFLDFHQLLRISRFQIGFHFHRFSQFSNEKVEIKFKTYFANAVEISMISIKLIKITIYQITIKKKKKNDDCFRFARITNNHQTCKNEKQSEWSWNFIHCLFSWLQKRKEKMVKLSNSFSYFNKQLSFILIHSTSSNQISQNHDEKRKRKWTSSTTIERIQYPIV